MLEIAGIVGIERDDLAAAIAACAPSLRGIGIPVIVVFLIVDGVVLVIPVFVVSPFRFSAKSEPVLHATQKTHSQCLAHMKQAPES